MPTADQFVITEKTSQARDVRAAVGGRYGPVLPAEGHLIDGSVKNLGRYAASWIAGWPKRPSSTAALT